MWQQLRVDGNENRDRLREDEARMARKEENGAREAVQAGEESDVSQSVYQSD